MADYFLATWSECESVIAFGLGVLVLAHIVGLALAWASGRHEQAEENKED